MASVKRHRIDIPDWVPPSLNVLMHAHWGTRNARKKRLYEFVGVYALQQGTPKATGRRRVDLRVTGWPKGGRLPDPDAFWKGVLDALVACGLLIDDCQAHCLMGSCELARGEPATVIFLTDLPPLDAEDEGGGGPRGPHGQEEGEG